MRVVNKKLFASKNLKKEFFILASKRAQYVAPDLMEQYWYAFVKTTIDLLRERGDVVLPDFGRMVLNERKARRAYNGFYKVFRDVKPHLMPSFTLDIKLKRYFKSLNMDIQLRKLGK